MKIYNHVITNQNTPHFENKLSYRKPVKMGGYYDVYEGQVYRDYIRQHMFPYLDLYVDQCYKSESEMQKILSNLFRKTVPVDNKLMNSIGLHNLEALGNNSYRGNMVRPSNPGALQKLKEAGIKHIIDLEGFKGLKEECEKLDLDYLYFKHIYYTNEACQPSSYYKPFYGWLTKTGDDYIKECRDAVESIINLVKTMQKGNVYIGCELGSDYTDSALLLDYIFNPLATHDSYVNEYCYKNYFYEGQEKYRAISELVNKFTDEDLERLGISTYRDFIYFANKFKSALEYYEKNHNSKFKSKIENNYKADADKQGLAEVTKILKALCINYDIDNDGLLTVDNLDCSKLREYQSMNPECTIYKVFPYIKRIKNDLVISNERVIIDKNSHNERIFNDFNLIKDDNGFDTVVNNNGVPLDNDEIKEIMRGYRVPGKIIPVDFRNLESIGGNMICSNSWIKAPKLKSVAKDVIIYHCIADLQQVETVGNNLKIFGKSYVRDNIFEKGDSYIFSRLETEARMSNLRTIGGWLQAEAPTFLKLTTIENRKYKKGDWSRDYEWCSDKQ